MKKWWWKWRERRPAVFEWDALTEAVDRACQDWKNAERIADMAETKEEIDAALYSLKLAERRYVYLLEKAREQYAQWTG
jgi:hypothetical protein